MANRRMFSNRIINSAKFLQMPDSAQLLYFHLGMRADDDGVVEAYPIIKMLGSNPDNVKILLVKGFLKQLNEDQVMFITDWQEHNTIRADRKVNSIYARLLEKKGIETIKPKPRSDVEDNTKRLNGPSTDGISKDKLSKDKLSKDNIKNVSNETSLSELTYNKDIKQSYKTKQDILKYRGLKSTPKALSEKQQRFIAAGKLIEEFRRAAEAKGFDLNISNAKRNSRISAQITTQLIQGRNLTGLVDWWFKGDREWCGYAPENLFNDKTVEEYLNNKKNNGNKNTVSYGRKL